MSYVIFMGLAFPAFLTKDCDFVTEFKLNSTSACAIVHVCKQNHSASNSWTMAKPSAGDILMKGLSSHSSSQANSEKSLSDGEDEVDVIPTRAGIKKSKQDDDGSIKGIDEDYDDDMSKHDDSSRGRAGDAETVATSLSGHIEEKRKPTYCNVFCSLFTCSYLFERYSIVDLGLNLGAIGLYIFDLITDWANAFNAYLFRVDEKGRDYLFYFGLTVAVITIPSLLMQLMSLWWEREDNQEMKKRYKHLKGKLGIFYYALLLATHILQVGPVYRYFRTIYYGLKSRYRELGGSKRRWRFYDDKYKAELADVNFVRLLESFLESAPQVVLQIYIMIKTADVLPITVLSVCVSAFGMSSSFVSYQRSLRNTLDDKQQISIIACVVLFIYRSLTNLSRVLALALLLNTSVWAWLMGIFGHWLAMTAIIIWRKTHFCTTQWKEYFYDFTIGFCYIFSYINVHADNLNACRMLLYYWLMFIENSIMALCWFYYRNSGSLIVELMGGSNDDMRIYNETSIATNVVISDDSALVLLVAVVASFILGMLFFVSYYLFFHPKASLKLKCGSENVEKSEENLAADINFIGQFSVTDSSHSEQVEIQSEIISATELQPRFVLTAVRRLYIPQPPSKSALSMI